MSFNKEIYNSKILGVIPARGGSKGIPHKNIRLLNGYPLIWYTHQSAVESKMLSRTIVSTDDSDIKSVCSKYGMDIPFIRPKSLAKDDSPTIDVVEHALQYLESIGDNYGVVCLLQPTCPIRESGLIDKAISQFYNSGADSLISVKKVPDNYNPHWVFQEDKDGFLNIVTGEKKIISRRQDLPNTFIRDGAIYITSTKVIKEQKSLYGNHISYFENNYSRHVNIDTVEDWVKAEQLMHIK